MILKVKLLHLTADPDINEPGPLFCHVPVARYAGRHTLHQEKNIEHTIKKGGYDPMSKGNRFHLHQRVKAINYGRIDCRDMPYKCSVIIGYLFYPLTKYNCGYTIRL